MTIIKLNKDHMVDDPKVIHAMMNQAEAIVGKYGGGCIEWSPIGRESILHLLCEGRGRSLSE